MMNAKLDKDPNALVDSMYPKHKPYVTDEGWICVPGKFEDGIITCNAPSLELDKIETFLYEVDISINN
jgi:hypothetical protein